MTKFPRQPTAITNELSALGLSEKEALVYAILLELGGAFPSKIAESAQLSRATTYAMLTSLSVKGLVQEMKRRNKLYYQVEKPTKLLRFAKDRVTLAEEGVKRAVGILPEIEGLLASTSNKPRLRFFEGYPEVLGVHEDHVAGNETYEMLAWANGTIASFLPNALRNRYLKKKETLKITTRAILPDTASDQRYNDTVYGHVAKSIWPKLRFVPVNTFPFQCEITIYGNNKVSILNFAKEHPIGLIIEDTMIHNMLRMIFELSWKSAGSVSDATVYS